MKQKERGVYAGRVKKGLREEEKCTENSNKVFERDRQEVKKTKR